MVTSVVRYVVTIAFGFASANLQAEVRTNVTPNAGMHVTVSVGEVLYKTDRYEFKKVRVAVLQNSLHRKIYLVDHIDLPFETEMIEDSNSPGFSACASEGYKDHSGIDLSVCLRDISSDGHFDTLYGPSIVRDIDLKQPLAYTVKEVEERAPNTAFSAVLTYSGVAAGALSLSYREFSNDMARPAFTEDLSIPLAASFPQVIAVKGVRFRLYRIDGLGVEYELLPPS